MLPRPSKRWFWLLLPFSAALFYIGAFLLHYQAAYVPPTIIPALSREVILPSYSASRARVAEAPVAREGVFLIDNAHDNDFVPDEISGFLSRVSAHGYAIEFVARRDVAFRPFNRGTLLKEKLRKADSLAIILPKALYTKEETETLRKFVAKGGKLLLIGDPGKDHLQRINSVADQFGFLFRPGYLYNVVEHELNYRNILIRDFRPDEITQGLQTITLYTAGAIKSSETPLAFTDVNTLSSVVNRTEPFTPLAKSRDGRIVALSDMSVLVPPQDSIADNDKLISNLASFLTDVNRRRDLSDFPHFFKKDIDILVGSAELFDLAARLKDMLAGFEMSSEVRGLEDLTKDTLFLGLYEDAPAMGQYLDGAGVQLNGTLRTPFTPDIPITGTSIMLLHNQGGRKVLVVLGDQRASVIDIVNRLDFDTFRDRLVSDTLGVFRGP